MSFKKNPRRLTEEEKEESKTKLSPLLLVDPERRGDERGGRLPCGEVVALERGAGAAGCFLFCWWWWRKRSRGEFFFQAAPRRFEKL